MKLPNMYRIRQRFDDARIEDIRETVKAELGALSWSAIRPGDRVAIMLPTGRSYFVTFLAILLAAGNIWETLVRSDTEHKHENQRYVYPQGIDHIRIRDRGAYHHTQPCFVEDNG